MAEFAELIIDQGTDFVGQMTLTDDYGVGTNVANASFVGAIKRSYGSANATDYFSISSSDPANGVVDFTLAAANTANIRAGRYVYDLKMTLANSSIRLVEGIITVTPQVAE